MPLFIGGQCVVISAPLCRTFRRLRPPLNADRCRGVGDEACLGGRGKPDRRKRLGLRNADVEGATKKPQL